MEEQLSFLDENNEIVEELLCDDNKISEEQENELFEGRDEDENL